MSVPVELSIIVEWENVVLSEDERAFRMLRQLRKQIAEVDCATEVIVLFNPQQIDKTAIEPALRENLRSNGDHKLVDLRIEEAEGKHYYSLKNEGATRARGQIVIFVDSDVVPEDSWLKEISRPFFEHPEVNFVAGHTYLAHQSLPQKAFALGWFFPLRNVDNTLHANSPRFFANNVAFRRETILQHPFPGMVDGTTRGACTQLARSLRASGISIWTNTAARANHPPPSGLQHYLIRAFAHGRDNILKWNAAGWPLWSKLRKSFEWSARRSARTAVHIKRERHRVSLPLWQAPAAFCIMFCFYTLVFVASCVTLAFPRYAAERWKI